MDDEPKIACLGVAELDRWLNDPPAPLAELMVELPFLRTEADAQGYLDDIREALEDVKHGRVVPHEVVLRDVAERRRKYRTSAAE